MDIFEDKKYPIIDFFDQDIITLYENAWNLIYDTWTKPKRTWAIKRSYIANENNVISLLDNITASFAIVYNFDLDLPEVDLLDVFYDFQEENGAIRCAYDAITGKPITSRNNPHGLAPPLFVWAEFNYFNRTDNKKRLKTVLPKLNDYLTWLEELCLKKNGLFAAPLHATHMHNTPRKNAYYLIDFNAQMALAYSSMSVLASSVNNRNLNFKYAKKYYNLKSLINKHFWDAETGLYYDITEKLSFVKVKTLASYWILLAKIPNNTQANKMITYLKSPNSFYSKNPFPTLSQDSSSFSEQGLGYRGSVYPLYTYMVIKGLDHYGHSEFSRECALKHIYSILDTWLANADKDGNGMFFEAYQADGGSYAKPSSKNNPIEKNHISIVISLITLIIENIIGISICAPRKIVAWSVINLESMGIELLNLNNNSISLVMKKTTRSDWAIYQSTEKLYYFNIKVQELKKEKTLPILSGKCSLLIHKTLNSA